MSDTIFNLPLPVVGLLITGLLCLFSVAGLELVRRKLLPLLRIGADDSEFSGTMVQAIMVFYGLAVALVAVSVWETHDGVSDVVSLEASRIVELHRDVGAYPEPLRSELRGELEGYVDYLIDKAWPSQRQGVQPTDGIQWMKRFQDLHESFEPESEAHKILHAEVLRAYNLLIEARRLRLDAMLTRLPGPLWFVIIAGAFISLSSTFFFRVEDPRLHRIQVLLLAFFIGIVITLVFAFDRPFHGDLAVDAGAYELIRDKVFGVD
jgi:hypothetical protein